MTPTLAFLQNIGVFEWVIILAVALLIFGRRLPEVGRSVGRAIVEFKKGLKDVTADVDEAADRESRAERKDSPALKSAGDQRRVSTADPVEEHA